MNRRSRTVKLEPIDAALVGIWYAFPEAIRTAIRRFVIARGRYEATSARRAYAALQTTVVRKWRAAHPQHRLCSASTHGKGGGR